MRPRPRPLRFDPPADPAAARAYWDNARGHVVEQIRRQDRVLAKARLRTMGGIRHATAWIVTVALTIMTYRAMGALAALLAALLLASTLVFSRWYNKQAVAAAEATIEDLEAELARIDERRQALEPV